MKNFIYLSFFIFSILILSSCDNFKNSNESTEEKSTIPDAESQEKIMTNENDSSSTSQESQVKLEEPQENDVFKEYDFCNSEEAILPNTLDDIVYDTNQGVARYKIPVPRGSKLLYVKVGKNKVMYVFTGSKYSNDIVYNWRKIKGLSRIESDTLTIEVLFAFYDEDKCNETPGTLTEKKKTTVVTGQPFIGVPKKY